MLGGSLFDSYLATDRCADKYWYEEVFSGNFIIFIQLMQNAKGHGAIVLFRLAAGAA